MIIQLTLDARLYPEIVELLSALPTRSRATKIRMMLEAHRLHTANIGMAAVYPETVATSATNAQNFSSAPRLTDTPPEPATSAQRRLYFAELECLDL